MELDAGALFRLIAAIGGNRQDPLAALRYQVEERRLRAELGELTPNPIEVTPAQLMSQRRDIVLVGQRGSGKTLGAVALALASGRTVFAVDWPADNLPPGVRACSATQVARQETAAFVWDEAAIRIGFNTRSPMTWETMALARQRDQSHVWTTQSAAAIPLDILRHNLTIGWLAGPSTFERSEMHQQATTARSILTVRQAPIGTFAAEIDGHWIVCRPEPPPGWTETHSTIWRQSHSQRR